MLELGNHASSASHSIGLDLAFQLSFARYENTKKTMLQQGSLLLSFAHPTQPCRQWCLLLSQVKQKHIQEKDLAEANTASWIKSRGAETPTTIKQLRAISHIARSQDIAPATVTFYCHEHFLGWPERKWNGSLKVSHGHDHEL